MNRKEILKQFLNEIKEDIGMIDGGCSSCVKEFITEVNEKLEKDGLKISINNEKSVGMAVGIEIEEIEKEKSYTIEEVKEAAQIDGQEIKTKNGMYHRWVKFIGDPNSKFISDWDEKPIIGRWYTVFEMIRFALKEDDKYNELLLRQSEISLRLSPDFQFKMIEP